MILFSENQAGFRSGGGDESIEKIIAENSGRAGQS
jgi:hypothetical protein